MKKRTSKKSINYLDDFFFAALLKMLCDQQVQFFLDLCKDINFPVSLDKNFLGNHMSDVSWTSHRHCGSDCCGSR